MKITDKDFLECYIRWNSQVNFFTAKLILSELKKNANHEAKKALYIKLYFEWIQAAEHLLAFVHTMVKSESEQDFVARIESCPPGGDSFRYLLNDLSKFKDDPYQLYTYLGLELSREQYLDDEPVFAGFYNSLNVALKNRYTDKGTTRLMKAFNKIKHGFPVYTVEGTDEIHILLKEKSKQEWHPFSFDLEFAEGLFDSIEAYRNTMMNASLFIIEHGLTKTKG
tara:strand:+ start:2141 stop:2812 length:672 start_codon:yes stop_codon:yes gene_type:complete